MERRLENCETRADRVVSSGSYIYYVTWMSTQVRIASRQYNITLYNEYVHMDSSVPIDKFVLTLTSLDESRNTYELVFQYPISSFVSSLLFSIDDIGDSEMVFGEMRSRIRHRLPDIRLTVGENFGKTQPDTLLRRTCPNARIIFTSGVNEYPYATYSENLSNLVHAIEISKYGPVSVLGAFGFLATQSTHISFQVVVITEDVKNVHLLLEYRPHIDVSLTCEHDPKLQEYCVCPQNMPQFDSEGIPNQAPETNKPMILNGPTSRNREGSHQVSVEAKQLGHLYLSIDRSGNLRSKYRPAVRLKCAGAPSCKK
ncbi:hypothetical protein ANN_01021 [Periplaneta americana]|uniref:Uncharacterized protein n=1 Tax=Periplaneta americana TaxID=6978 RepID=A0ABQ8TTI9_PERAM|nr:hypothetical protein ANN_01021 [Periplaneta americana]